MTTKRKEYLLRKFAGIIDLVSVVLAIITTIVGIFSTGVISFNGGTMLLLLPLIFRLATYEDVDWFKD